MRQAVDNHPYAISRTTEGIMKELPTRKRNRLHHYDYSQNGAYFLTICAKGRKEIFGRVVGAVDNRPPHIELSEIGQAIEKEIHTMQQIRTNVTVDQYIIMPNHIHIIIVINNGMNDDKRLTTTPTVSEIIRLWKRAVSKQIGFSPWQRTFHDHIIRNRENYTRIAEYIENNPANWQKDCFYGGKI
jgi:REP element-mobilizing transposase RayT